MPDTGMNTRSARDNGAPLLVSGSSEWCTEYLQAWPPAAQTRRGRARKGPHYSDQQNVGSPPSAETLRP